MQNYILYQAYGRLDYINECRFSLLKYLSVYNLKPPANTSVIIYTDKPALFESFSSFFTVFEMKTVTGDQVKKWEGDSGFVHRVKIEIIKDFFTQHNGNLLYFDTDTYAITPLEGFFAAIEKGTFFMHEYEGIVNKNATPSLHKWDNFLRNNTFEFNGKQFSFHNGIKMWNAGVIGMNVNKQHIIEDVLALTDVVHKQFKKHIAEQFAFSYILQQHGTVQSTSENIVHYWNLKEFRSLLNIFFKKNEEESVPNLIKLIHHIDPVKIQDEKEQYEKLPLYKKWMQMLTGKNWSIKQYQNKI